MITPDLQKQCEEFAKNTVKEAIINSNLSDSDALRLFEREEILKAEMTKIIKLLSSSDRFFYEEVPSAYKYPENYKIKKISEQVEKLQELFPELEKDFYDEEVLKKNLPEMAEGWFAIPRWEKIAPTYNEALEKVLLILKKGANLNDYCEKMVSEKHLRQKEKSKEMFKKISNEQKRCEILVIPCQFGLRHRGRSPRLACDMMGEKEFALGAFAVGCMLLTHSEREICADQLHVDCPGDETNLEFNEGIFSGTPYFLARKNTPLLYSRWHGGPINVSGAASGFIC